MKIRIRWKKSDAWIDMTPQQREAVIEAVVLRWLEWIKTDRFSTAETESYRRDSQANTKGAPSESL